MKLPLKLKEMRDGEVHYISLVDKSSSRIPFRVVKKETGMIDLSAIGRIFKRAENEKPTVSGVIVYAQKQDALSAQVREAIQKAGFKVDTVAENPDGETVLFSQQENALEGAQLVRLSEQMILAVKGFSPQNLSTDTSDFASAAASNSFHQGVDSSLDILFSKICSVLNDATDEADASDKVGGLIDGFKKYIVGLVESLPTAAFKADLAVKSVVSEACKQENLVSITEAESFKSVVDLVAKTPTGTTNADWAALDVSKRIQFLYDRIEKREVPGTQMVETAANKGETALVKPAELAQEEWDQLTEDGKKAHLARFATQKSESTALENQSLSQSESMKQILEALNGVTAKMDGFSTQLVQVSEKQQSFESTLGSLTQKSDLLEEKLTGAVIGQAKPGDTPAPGGKETTTKSDPRSGAFDTALLRRRR